MSKSKKKELGPQLSINLEAGKESVEAVVDTSGTENEPQEVSYMEKVARTYYEVNRAFCEGHGDSSQEAWDEALKEVRDAAIERVTFYFNNPNTRIQDMHDLWVANKIENGWSHAEVKDADKKESPYLVSYRELSVQQKTKDILFLETVKSFITI